MKGLLPVLTAVTVACTASTIYFAANRPIDVRTKKVTVKETENVYVLSPSGTAQDVTVPKGVKGEDLKTGYKVVSDWTNKQTGDNWGDGFSVVEVDGQRCILWIRNARGYNGDETGNGMSCRPIPAK